MICYERDSKMKGHYGNDIPKLISENKDMHKLMSELFDMDNRIAFVRFPFII